MKRELVMNELANSPREAVVDLVVGGQHGRPPDHLRRRRLHPAVQRLAPLAEQLL